MKTFMTVAGGILLALGLTSAASAGVRVGQLRCHIHHGEGYVVGSVHKARCHFTSVDGHRERYWGSMKRIGLDLGYTRHAVLVWDVFAPTGLGPHALAGDYVGASADVSVGIGAGANVLVGGNGGTISLQPLSLKHETGVALGAGAGKLELR
ncbi:MAG: DUF992 domain-containing protein [Rhodomicrobium sp.]